MHSYNHPAWQYTYSPHHAATLDASASQPHPTPRPRFTSMSGPSSPCAPQATLDPHQSFVPSRASLAPGPQNPRIWDKRATLRPRTSHGTMASPYPCQSFYGDYFSPRLQIPVTSPPRLPQKPHALLKPLTNPLPPIPPKPPALAVTPGARVSLYPDSIPLPIASPPSQPPDPVVPETTPHLGEKAVELALSLSVSEARQREEELIAQEEEELARALEESRLMSNQIYTVDDQASYSPTSPRSPSVDRISTTAIKASAHPSEGESWLHLVTPTASTSSQHSALNDDPSPLQSPITHVESDGDPSEIQAPRGSPTVRVQNLRQSRESLPLAPPLYTNTVSGLVRKSLPTPSPTRTSVTATSPPATTPAPYLQNDYTPPPDCISTASTVSLIQSRRPSSSEPSPMPPPFTSRPSWTSLSVSSETSLSNGHSLGSDLVPGSSGYRSPAYPSTSPSISPVPLDALGEGVEEEKEEPETSTRPVAPLSANHYVEREMLLGVSMGFTHPVISTELLSMSGPMPNVITLPYGRAPIFHLQAPSWRKLLKLMARLSATRVEPTIDAISTAKHELKLRTVIQFVKVHHSASEWRTVLYLTTDYPIPSNILNPHKYTNGDVTVLPYSYTMTPLPALLRDGPESLMAKYYVVPSTPNTPYPNLPINFPNLAMYLQSAVQDSRRHCSDNSSGQRKLAQYIDGCYQAEEPVAQGDPEGARKRVGNMFKRVIGRNKVHRRSGGNEEIYDLVTPFVSDEWG